jgi:arylsulfatase A-like enzyme
MATVAAILGQELPDHAAEDSVSILPVLLGEPLAKPIREVTIHHSARGKFAIRKGDWVLIDAPSGDDNGANGEPAWLKKERGYTKHEQPVELYNVREDLAQRNNLVLDKPELVRALKSLLQKVIEDGRSTPGEVQPNDVQVQPFVAPAATGKP